MINFISFFESNYYDAVEAVSAHRRENVLNTSPCELRLYWNSNSGFSIKSVLGNSGNRVYYGDYCVLFRCGGEGLTAWDCIGDTPYYLPYEDRRKIISCISKDNNIDESKVSEENIKKFITENEPDLIDEWFELALDRFEETYYDFGEDVIDRFLEKLEEELDSDE